MGKSSLCHDITIKRAFAASPQDIWRSLTEAQLISQWLMQTDFVATVGRSFTFRSKPMLGWNGIVHGRVLDVAPYTRIAYTWTGDADMPETVVTWSLHAEERGTTLTLTHIGFCGLKYSLVGRMLEYGWKRMLTSDLPRVLAGLSAEKPPRGAD